MFGIWRDDDDVFRVSPNGATRWRYERGSYRRCRWLGVIAQAIWQMLMIRNGQMYEE